MTTNCIWRPHYHPIYHFIILRTFNLFLFHSMLEQDPQHPFPYHFVIQEHNPRYSQNPTITIFSLQSCCLFFAFPSDFHIIPQVFAVTTFSSFRILFFFFASYPSNIFFCIYPAAPISGWYFFASHPCLLATPLMFGTLGSVRRGET